MTASSPSTGGRLPSNGQMPPLQRILPVQSSYPGMFYFTAVFENSRVQVATAYALPILCAWV